MKLKLKEQFIGTIISKKVQLKPMQMVNLTFDSTIIEEENYIKYYNLGFEELFDIEKEEELPLKDNITYITFTDDVQYKGIVFVPEDNATKSTTPDWVEEYTSLTKEQLENIYLPNDEAKILTIDYNGEENKPIKKTRKPRKRKENNE